jgi:hypothetical protein
MQVIYLDELNACPDLYAVGIIRTFSSVLLTFCVHKKTSALSSSFVKGLKDANKLCCRLYVIVVENNGMHNKCNIQVFVCDQY